MDDCFVEIRRHVADSNGGTIRRCAVRRSAVTFVDAPRQAAGRSSRHHYTHYMSIHLVCGDVIEAVSVGVDELEALYLRLSGGSSE